MERISKASQPPEAAQNSPLKVGDDFGAMARKMQVFGSSGCGAMAKEATPAVHAEAQTTVVEAAPIRHKTRHKNTLCLMYSKWQERNTPVAESRHERSFVPLRRGVRSIDVSCSRGREKTA